MGESKAGSDSNIEQFDDRRPLDDLVDRVTSLERRNMRLILQVRLITCIAIVIVIFSLCKDIMMSIKDRSFDYRVYAGSLTTKALTAESIHIKTPRGDAQISLGFNSQNQPAIAIYNEKKESKITMGLNKFGLPALHLRDPQGNIRTGIHVSAKSEKIYSGLFRFE